MTAALAIGAVGCDGSRASEKPTVRPAATGWRLHEGLAPSRGGTRYVSPRGSDRTRGTRRSPWRTVQKALDTLRPGQTAVVRRGTYAENLVMTRAGTPRAPITVRGERGAVLTAGRGQRDNVPLELAGGSAYVRIEGVVIRGATGPSTTNVYASGDAHDIELSRCVIRDSQRQGFFSERTTSRIAILRSTVRDNGGDGPNQLDHNIYIEGRGHLIANDVVSGARNGFGIQIYPSSDHIVVANNTIVGNYRDGIIVGSDDATTTSGALIVNNIVARNGRYGISTYWGGRRGTGNVARNNLGWRNAEGSFVGDGIAYKGNRVANPRFARASTGDFHLRRRSPALGRALRPWAPRRDRDGRRRPVGAGPDIGAYERGR